METFSIRQKKFMDKAIQRFGGKLDLSKVHYENIDSPVTVKCLKHGYFDIKARYLMKYEQPCAKCRSEEREGVVTVCSTQHEVLLPSDIQLLINRVFQP